MVITTPIPGDPLEAARTAEAWWVLYTRSRREKQVARTCSRLGVRHYLPLHPGRLRRTGGGERLLVPVFPGYVFVCPTPEGRGELLRTGAVVRSLAVSRPDVLLDELRGIRTVLEAGKRVVPATALARGRRVRVIDGPLRGVEGMVCDRRVRRGRVNLVLEVSLLGEGAMVTIEAGSVEPLGGWEDRSGVRGTGSRIEVLRHRPAGGA
jgi:transcription antitermination factor NusG